MQPAASLAFTVPGDPVAKERPRFAASKGRVRTYTPPATVRYENTVRLAARVALAGAAPPAGPLRVRLALWIEPPASWSKRRRADALAGLIAATKKPDADNVAKAILDGCNGVAFADDAHIVELTVSKRYGECAHAAVLIESTGGQMAP